MSIQEIWTNFKRFVTDSESIIAFLLIGVGIGSFWLGRLSVTHHVTDSASLTQNTAETQSALPHAPVTREAVPQAKPSLSIQKSPQVVEGGDDTAMVYVASKTGTKYHLPWCAGAQRIKDENKVWFATKEDAEAAGYTPAANCKGI